MIPDFSTWLLSRSSSSFHSLETWYLLLQPWLTNATVMVFDGTIKTILLIALCRVLRLIIKFYQIARLSLQLHFNQKMLLVLLAIYHEKFDTFNSVYLHCDHPPTPHLL